MSTINNIKHNLLFNYTRFLTGLSFIFSFFVFIWAWYSIHSMKLEEVARQASADAKNQIIMKKLEELSVILQEVSTKIPIIEPIVPQDTEYVFIGLIILCYSALFYHWSFRSTLVDFRKENDDNYKSSCLPENFDACDTALRGDLAKGYGEVVGALGDLNQKITTVSGSVGTQLTHLSDNVRGVDSRITRYQELALSNIPDARFGTLNTSSNRIQEKLDNLKNMRDVKYESFEARLDVLTSRLDNYENNSVPPIVPGPELSDIWGWGF